MIDESEAVRLARQWVNHERAADQQRDVQLHAFDGGWVAWPADGQPADPTAPPGPDAGPRAVIDARTGAVSVWPSLPAAVIAARYRAETGLAPQPGPPRYAPVNAGEAALLQARRSDDAVGYARALASVELLVPFVTRWGNLPRTVLAERDGRPHLLVFSSPEAARLAFAAAGSGTSSRTWNFVRTTLTQLLDGWARPETGLTVDPGTPMEASMTPAALHAWLTRAGIPARDPGPPPASSPATVPDSSPASVPESSPASVSARSAAGGRAGSPAGGPAADPQPIAVFSQTPLQAGRGVFLLLAGVALMVLALAVWSKLGVGAWLMMAFALLCLGIGGGSLGTFVREARYASRLRASRPG